MHLGFGAMGFLPLILGFVFGVSNSALGTLPVPSPPVAVGESFFYRDLFAAITQSTPLDRERLNELNVQIEERHQEYSMIDDFLGTIFQDQKLRELGRELAQIHRTLERLDDFQSKRLSSSPSHERWADAPQFSTPEQRSLLHNLLDYHHQLIIEYQEIETEAELSRTGFRAELRSLFDQVLGRDRLHPHLLTIEAGVIDVTPEMDVMRIEGYGQNIATRLRLRAYNDRWVGELEFVRAGVRAGNATLNSIARRGESPALNADYMRIQLRIIAVLQTLTDLIESAKRSQYWTQEQREFYQQVTAEYYYNLLPELLEGAQFRDNYYNTLTHLLGRNRNQIYQVTPFRSEAGDEMSRNFIEIAGHALVTPQTVQLRWIAGRPLDLRVRFEALPGALVSFKMILEIQNPFGGDHWIQIQKTIYSDLPAPTTPGQLKEFMLLEDWISPLESALTRSFELDPRALRGTRCSTALTSATF